MSNEHGTVSHPSSCKLLPSLVDTNGKTDTPSHRGEFDTTTTVSTMHHDSHVRSSVDNRENFQENIQENIQTPIYRYEFTQEFIENLSRFSKIHQYDDRHVFKESWDSWIQENSELVNQEIIRLHNLQYDGDILDKMFKSARYYFRKKGTEKKAPKERKSYISFSKQILDCMDEHIFENTQQSQQTQKNQKDPKDPKDQTIKNQVKPSVSFIDFCQTNKEVIKETISYLNQQGIKDLEEIQNKVKKTYKNRYFMIKTQLQEKI
jgi:hypothetical protein